MEWVEVTGRTIEEARSIALDQLGVAEGDAEFEVLDEPKPGLFGRTRGEARLRARVRPATPRSKGDRRQRRDRGSKGESREQRQSQGSNKQGGQRSRRGGGERDARRGEGTRQMRDGDRNERSDGRREREDREPVDPAVVADAAAAFLGGLATAFGTKASVAIDRDGEDLEVRLEGDDLGLMVGPRGTTLQAIQDLTRVASQRRLGDQDTRLRVDIAGYREKRREALARFALKVAEEVKETGQSRVLEPMLAPDRKVVHDTLAEVDGISTRSQGEEPRRRVVVDLADSDD